MSLNPLTTPPIPAALASNASDSPTNCPIAPLIPAIPAPDEGSLSASSKDMSLIGGAAAEAGLAAPAPKPAGKTAASLKIQLLIKASDIGLEALYLELAAAGSTSHRTRHVKRVLHQIVCGQHAPGASDLGNNASPAACSGRMPSFKIEFRISERDVGLEKLFLEICRIEGASQRSHYVKRRLFNAYFLSAQPRSAALPLPVQPAPAAMALAHSNQPKPQADVLISSWPSSSPTDTPEPAAGIELDERHMHKRKRALALLELSKSK